MAKDYTAQARKAKNFTQSTETTISQTIADQSEFLPVINRTESIKRFFGSTVNQLLSTGSTQSIDAYWGRIRGRTYNAEQELFNPETDADRINYQFQPGVTSRRADNVESVTSYVNWLHRLQSLGADIDNHDRLFAENGYTLDVPINIDMFVNYSNYYWLEGLMPIIEIDAAQDSPIDIDDIVALSHYTTPLLATSNRLEFLSGLRVKFVGDYVTSTSGDYQLNYVYYVENVGGSNIKLVESEDENGETLFPNIMPYSVEQPRGWDLDPFDTTPWDEIGYFADYDVDTTILRDDLNLNKTYIVMDRSAIDKNPWARSNQWFSVYALRAMAEFNGVELEAFLNSRTRAKRPVIEFRADMQLFNTCKNYAGQVDYVLTVNEAIELLDNPLTFGADGGESGLTNGDIVLVGTNPDELPLLFPEYGTGFNTAFDSYESADPGSYNSEFGGGFQVSGSSVVREPFSRAFGPAYEVTTYDPLSGGFTSGFTQGFPIVATQPVSADELFNNVYVVTGVGTGIVLQPYENTFVADDYVIVRKGVQRGNVYCYNGRTWSLSQMKTHRGQAPLFNLYSDELVDLSALANSNFEGDKVFGYKVNSSGVIDKELGFAPTYSSAASKNDFEFEWTLNNNRYIEDITMPSQDEVPGLYNWYDCVTEDYLSGWSNIRGGQRVPIVTNTIADGINTVEFDTANTTYGFGDAYGLGFELGSTELAYSTEYSVQYTSKGYRWFTHSYIDRVDIGEANPDLVWKTSTNYIVNDLIATDTHDIEFVDPYGNTAGIYVSTLDRKTIVNIGSDYAYSKVIYRSTTDPTITGDIVVSNSNHERFEIRKNGQILQIGIDYTLSGSTITMVTDTRQGDVLELKYIADADINQVVYDVAPVHYFNSTNEPFTGASYSELFGHFDRQMVAMPGFEGKLVGENNYHRARRLHTYDGLIRQQIFETPKIQYLLDQEVINPIKALKVFARDYTQFKTYFKNKVKQLWTTESFNSVHDLVDRALTDINIGKNEDFKYAHSDMAYYRRGESKVYSVTDATIRFAMAGAQNKFGDTQNHVQVFLKEYNGVDKYIERTLRFGTDYTIVGANIVLNSPVVLNGNSDPATVTVRWFAHIRSSHIPYSAVKLGFFRPTNVEIVNGELIGHDGSRHTTTGTEYYDTSSSDFDVVTAALLDYETRVISNLVPEHTSQFDMGIMYPNPHSEFSYSINDINLRLDDWFNRYAVRNDIAEIDVTPFNLADRFTWNYNSVAPNLGSWRSVYTYYFGTDRPHTHPWEMLGHRVKPIWWDANYSWTAGGQRDALINALKYGIVGNPGPGLEVDVEYARNEFDWDGADLVTSDGLATLLDPVDARVVDQPSDFEAAKDLVFGDWSEVENVWRKSSEYPFALAEAYLQLKPYRTHELWWSLGRWTINNNATQTQWIDTDTCQRRNAGEIHNQLIDTGIIAAINVTNGGSGYTTATVDFPANQICTFSAEAIAQVDSGVITSVVVTNGGRGYTSAPTDVVISGDGTGAILEYDIDYSFYATHLGFNTLPAEEFTPESSDSTELAEALDSLSVEFVMHVGGYTDKRIMELQVDGSYESGRLQIPQTDYDIILDRNVPIKSAFFSGVKIERVDNGFRVDGYNLDSKFFVYTQASTSGTQVTEQVAGTTLTRYLKFKNELTRIPYRTTFTRRQALYDFLNGLANYYSTIGFDVADEWRVQSRQAIEWALGSDTEPFYLNGITDTLTYQQGPQGFVNTVSISYDGYPNVIDRNFKNIKQTDMLVLRNDTDTEFSLKAGTNRIFGLGVRVIELEHVISIRNITEFNDIIYSPAKGIGQNRVRLLGERTRNWNGRLEAPGYLVKDNGLILNFESNVREVERDWINTENKALEKLTRQTQGYNVGYSKPTYMQDTFVGDVSAYRFEKGRRKYKGTESAFDAMTRNKNIFGQEFEYEMNEEWLVRLGNFGDLSESQPLQFEIDPDKINSDSQQIRFNSQFVSDLSNDLIIDLHKNGPDAISGNFDTPFSKYPYFPADNTKITLSNQFQNFNKDAGLPLVTEIDYFVGSIDNIDEVYDPTEDYALLRNWSQTFGYTQGDVVRYDGKVYRLAIESTGLNRISDQVIIRGTQVFPEVVNGTTFIANGETVTFTKQSTSVTNDSILVEGSVTNPSVPSSTTLVLDGINVNFINTDTTVTWQDIVLDGTITSPVVVNSATETFVIQYANSAGAALTTVTVNFDEARTTETLQQIHVDALNSIAGYTGNRSNDTIARLAAWEALRTAYLAVPNTTAAWEAWVDAYYATAASATFALNPEYIGAEITANPGAAWIPEATAMIDNDLLLIENTTGNNNEDSASIISGVLNNAGQFATDLATTNAALLADGDLLDFFVWQQTNGALAITSGVTITVSPALPVRYVTDTLSSAIIKINTALTNAGVTDISASVFNNGLGDVLRITRTNTDQDYRLVIGSGSANDNFGFSNNVEGNLSSVTATVGVDLTITQVVNAINAAAIANVSAASVNNRLRIQSTNEQLTIGSGTANASLGIGNGVVDATTTETNVPINLTIFDVVSQINLAGIDDLIASQVEGVLVLTFSGLSITIGAGTANTALGISEGTTETRTDDVENTFNLNDWNQIEDPADFNIWVVDNIGSQNQIQSTSNRYQVYQTVDLDLGVEEICAGNENGDDALVKTNRAHTLSEGEYVLILNSTCVPNMDGIHRVTSVNSDNNFFVDFYIEQKGFTGKVFPLRTMRFGDSVTVAGIINDTRYVDGASGLRSGTYVYADQVLDGSNNSLGYGAVYLVSRLGNDATLDLIRLEETKTNNSKIVNGVLFSDATRQTVGRYEVFDPLKGLIAGAADREIDIRTEIDIAAYDNSTDPDKTLQPKTKWGRSRLGSVWWDLSNAIYLDYDQGSDEYKQEYWGQLFPTGTIDLYEWTKSPVTPDEYADAVSAGTIVDGIPLTGTAYNVIDTVGDVQYYWSEEVELNTNTNQLEIYYYFWVQNKTTVPDASREFSVQQLEEIVSDPSVQDINWIAATGVNTMLISGLTGINGYRDLRFQVNFDNSEVDHHQEYMLLAENDAATHIPEWLHMSLRDSLAKFTQTSETVEFRVWDIATTYSEGDVVIGSNGKYYINHTTSITIDPVIDNQDNIQDYWRKLEVEEVNPPGDYNGLDTIRYSTPQSIPDLKLHPFVRYGLETRPHQIWFKDIEAARKVAVAKINSQLEMFNLIDSDIDWREAFDREFVNGDQTFNIADFWTFTDWHLDPNTPYIEDNSNYYVALTSDLAALNPSEGEIAHVTESNYPDNIERHSAYRYVGTEWTLIYKEQGTIQFTDLLWNNTLNQMGWDTAPWDTTTWDNDTRNVLVEIFDSLYTDIWIGQYRQLYTDLWFQLAKYVLTEQDEVDWIFKSSYIKLAFEDSLEKDYNKYFRQNVDELFEYVNTVKPFRTKIRDAAVRKKADDELLISMENTIEVRIETNPLDENTDETNTRSFRLSTGRDGQTYSSQIVDQRKLLLGLDISSTEQFIPLLRFGTNTFPTGAGSFWMNGERIEYTGVETIEIVGDIETGAYTFEFSDEFDVFGASGAYTFEFSDEFDVFNRLLPGGQDLTVVLLTGITRGTHGTFARPHTFADVAEDETNLELVEAATLEANGNSLEIAWNDSGFSLLDVSNTATNAATINGEAFGTIGIRGTLETARDALIADGAASFQNELAELIRAATVAA